MSDNTHQRKRVVVIHSGGLDSTTLLYHLLAEGHEVRSLTVLYGQRHQRREVDAAAEVCRLLGVPRRVVDLSALAGLFGQNALSDPSVAVPEGRYEPQSMQLTTVPNRNMVFLSVALAWAVSLEFDAVAFGAHAGRSTPYPDCKPEFAEAMDRVASLCDWKPVRVLAPFVGWSKAQIVRRGAELSVPFEHTWSCYQGGVRHCGRCGTCIDRKEAFAEVGYTDPAEYD